MNKDRIAVDSLKYRLPMHCVTIKDVGLSSRWLKVNETTGDIDIEFFNENSISKKEKGITTKFMIQKQPTADKTVEEFLIINFNSKLLKGGYLDGITRNNIKDVYAAIMAYNVVEFSYADFLEVGECTDVDFKVDVVQPNLEGYLKIIEKHTKESKSLKKGCLPVYKKDNLGLQFSTRAYATPANPFLKFYSKERELKYHSHEFAREYLDGQNYENVVRAETTVKNKKHFRDFGINNTTLGFILDLSGDKKELIIRTAIAKHLEPRTQVVKARTTLTPTDNILYVALQLIMEAGTSYALARQLMIRDIEDKSTRSRKGRDLDNIYSLYIKGSKADLATIDADQFFNAVGWA